VRFWVEFGVRFARFGHSLGTDVHGEQESKGWCYSIT